MIYKNVEACGDAILDAAKKICVAAATAPKACGKDTVRTAILTGEDIELLAAKMDAMEDDIPNCLKIFRRDSALIRKSSAVVLVGVIRQTRGLTPCGLCGNANCGETLKGSGPCAFDDIDLGIALGSAASLAADFRLDNRILYTAGMAALELKLLGEDVRTVMALPLSASNKNIFFDRK